MARDTTLEGAWRDLAHAYGGAYGGVAGLAEAIGVSETTLWRYGRGEPVPAPARAQISALAKKARLPEPPMATRTGSTTGLRAVKKTAG